MRTPTRTIHFIVLSFALPLVLSGCFGSADPVENGESSSSSSSDFVATPNVSYTGIIRALETSIYMEGTHKLVQNDGSIVLLTAADQAMNLDRYVGEAVEVRGSVRPTVEGNATHMQVTEVTPLDEDSSSSEESEGKFCGGIAGFGCPAGFECKDDPSDSCDPANGGADCGGICTEVTAMSSSSEASVAAARSSSSSAKTTPPIASSRATVSSSASSSSVTLIRDLEAAITLMAKQDHSAGFWTQQYCTGHIAFCIPAHKNWYYKSFGATTSNPWHVEFAMEEIESLGMGPIVLNLVDGTVESVSGVDGGVQTKGEDVIGFKSWNDDTHFEIIADARLSAAVSYMISRITPYTPAP